jgi:hypothetical protein
MTRQCLTRSLWSLQTAKSAAGDVLAIGIGRHQSFVCHLDSEQARPGERITAALNTVMLVKQHLPRAMPIVRASVADGLAFDTLQGDGRQFACACGILCQCLGLGCGSNRTRRGRTCGARLRATCATREPERADGCAHEQPRTRLGLKMGMCDVFHFVPLPFDGFTYLGLTSYCTKLFVLMMLTKFAPYWGLVAYLLLPIAWAKATGSLTKAKAAA